MCVYSRIAAQSGWARGLRIGLQRLPAYILQGGTNLSPQVSLDWPGSESSTVQSREDGRGGRGEEKESKVGGGGGGRVGKHCINARLLSLTLLASHELKHRQPQRHTRTPRTDYESWQHSRQERRSGPRRSLGSLLRLVLQLLNKRTEGSCWKAKPLSALVYYVCDINYTSKIEGSHLLEWHRTTQWKRSCWALLYRGDEGKPAGLQAVHKHAVYLL